VICQEDEIQKTRGGGEHGRPRGEKKSERVKERTQSMNKIL
jgi:hypothetical protein